MSERGVLLTESTANWATQAQRQSRPLPGSRFMEQRGVLDRPTGGIWFYGEVQSIDVEAKTAVVRVDIATVGHNPAGTDGTVSIGWSVDAGVTTVVLPAPEAGKSYWFQMCHVPGDIQGDERSPAKWVMLEMPTAVGTVVKTYTLAIEEGTPTSGAIAIGANDSGITSPLTLSWAWNVDPATVETDLSTLRNADDSGPGVLSVVGAELPFNVIKIQVTSNVSLSITSHSLVTEARSLTVRPSLPFCFEPVPE